jgi:hypothetical protein
MKYTYQLTDEYRDRVYVETGKRPALIAEFEAADTELTSAQRQTVLDYEAVVPRQALERHGLKTASYVAFVPHGDSTSFAYRGTAPKIDWRSVETNALLDLDGVMVVMTEAMQVAGHFGPILEAETQRYKADRQAWTKVKQQRQAEADGERLRLKKEHQAQREAEREASMVINWREETGDAIHNLYRAVWNCADLHEDRRWTQWVKHVTRVNMKVHNGWCFEGNWLQDATAIVPYTNMLFLVCSQYGSRKHRIKEFRVVILRDGKLEATNIITNDSDPGWALRIREPVEKLLAEINADQE